MEEKRLDLEPAVIVGGHELIPVAWTVGRPVVEGRRLHAAMCREAFGVIVRDDAGLRVLLANGGTMTLDELVAVCPSLAPAVSALK